MCMGIFICPITDAARHGLNGSLSNTKRSRMDKMGKEIKNTSKSILPKVKDFTNDWSADDWVHWAYMLGLKLDDYVPWAGVDNRWRIELAICGFITSKEGR